jgi:hypothetical protein
MRSYDLPDKSDGLTTDEHRREYDYDVILASIPVAARVRCRVHAVPSVRL